MPEHHLVVRDKVHIYKPPNSSSWQCSTSLAAKNRRTGTKEESLSKAKEIDEGLQVLDSRQELTGADRQWAGQYEAGDVLRYSRGSNTESIAPGDYARVAGVDPKENCITIEVRMARYRRTIPDDSRVYPSSRRGELRIRMDSGREVRFNIGEHPHLDYGYAVTSHSSQGQTAQRC